MQSLIVALLVAGSAVYAAWYLMPRMARQFLAVRLLPLPLPGPLAAVIQRAATAGDGCACHGCEHGMGGGVPDSNPAGRTAEIETDAKPVRFYRKYDA